MAGIQYLDELFSALRNTAEQLAIADSWISRAENASPASWRMFFLETARTAQKNARRTFEEAAKQLADLGPADKLPSLLAGMPERLEELKKRLEMSEKRLSLAWDEVLDGPRGRA